MNSILFAGISKSAVFFTVSLARISKSLLVACVSMAVLSASAESALARDPAQAREPALAKGVAPSTGGTTVSDETVSAVFNKITSYESSTQKSAAACELPAKADCTLETYCAAVAPQRHASQLYEGEGGFSMPNFTLLYAAEAYGACTQPELAQKLASTKEDPFVHPQLFSKPEQREKYETSFRRAEGILEQMRKRIAALLAKKRTSKNAGEIDAMISRLSTVKLGTMTDFSEEGLARAGCQIPNAFYNTEGAAAHTITLCPQYLNLPEATLSMALAHELAHSFDPCISSQVLASKNEKPSGFQLVHPLDGLLGKSDKVLSKGISPTKYPFSDALKCLQSKNSTGLRVPSTQEQRRSLESQLETLEQGTSSEEREQDPEVLSLRRKLRDLEDRNQAMGYCPSNDGTEDKRSFMQESFADLISSEVLSSIVAEKPAAAAKKWAFETQLIALEKECLGFSESQKNELFAGMKSKQCDTQKVESLFGIFTDSPKTHLSMNERFSRIYFAPKPIQAALGCQAKKVSARPAPQSCF